MVNGTVVFFNDSGGYGFIECDEVDDEEFVHMDNIGGPDLEEGDEIKFDIERTEQGPRARNPRRVSE